MTTRLRTLPKDRRGFTIVELIVAILILTVGVIGLTSTAAVVTKQLGRGNLQTIAATRAQSRFDSLTSVSCQNLASAGTQTGTVSSRGVTEKWVITDGNDIKTIEDTVRFAGRTNPLVYRTIIPCRD